MTNNTATTYYIIKAANHDELGFPKDYAFTRYNDREVAGKVALKMANRKNVTFTVIMFCEGVQAAAGTYGPGQIGEEAV